MKPYYEHAGITIYHGDCLEVIPKLPPVDLVIADPPYNFTTASAGSGKLNPWADICNSSFWFCAWVKKAMDRLSVNQGALWQFCNWRTLPAVTKAVFEAGYQIESLLVWDKDWIGPGGVRGLRPSYELVALICHDKFRIRDRGLCDIQKFPWSSTKPTGHPAEKPTSIVSWLISISGGGVILDPFMGSGTTLVSAKNSGFDAIGIDLDISWCERAVDRLRQEVFNFGQSAVSGD